MRLSSCPLHHSHYTCTLQFSIPGLLRLQWIIPRTIDKLTFRTRILMVSLTGASQQYIILMMAFFYLQAQMLLFVSLELPCWQPQDAEREWQVLALYVARQQKICAHIWAATSFALPAEFLKVSQQLFQAHSHVAFAVVLVSPSAQLPSRNPDVQLLGNRNAHTRRISSTAALTKAPTIAHVAMFLLSASFAYIKTVRQTGGQQFGGTTLRPT